MNRIRRRRRLSWWDITALGMYCAVVIVGLAAYNRTLGESVVAIGFLAAVLLIAKLWQRTIETARTAKPATRRQKVWNAAVLVVWLSVVVLAVCWWWTGGKWPPLPWPRADADMRAIAADEPAEDNQPKGPQQVAKP